MLVSLTRLGASRQGFAKALAVVGADTAAVRRAVDGGLQNRTMSVESFDGVPGLLVVRSSLTWLGTRPGRDEAFACTARSMAELAEIVRRSGGALVAPGVAIGQSSPVLGGDTHVLEVLSPVEQEVLCNLLRTHVPALIAMTGRGVTAAGRAPDRVGSRWLAESRSHLATRFIASTTPEHLDRVKAELRRRDGVAQLERMDVAPSASEDGRPTVVVRCVDAAVGVAGLRAQSIILAAIAMHARRLVRDGRRTGHAPQRLLEENRARAVAAGLRARFVRDDHNRAAAPSGSGGRRQPEGFRSADDAVRDLLIEIGPELRNLDAGADELAPVLLGIDLPRFGGPSGVVESMLLREWAARGDGALVEGCRAALTDPEPGGPLLREMRDRKPGLVAALLQSWKERIAAASASAPGQRSRPPGQGQPAGRRVGTGNRSRREGGHRGRPRQSPRDGNNPHTEGGPYQRGDGGTR